MAYPCCCCTPVSVSTPSCPSGDCLKVASIVVNPSSSVLPCGASGTVDIGAESDLDICTTGINWYLLPVSEGGYDEDAFTGVSLSSSGVLSFTTTSLTALNTFYRFNGKVTCSDTLLSQYFYVLLSVKNACLEIVCPDGQTCSPCDGTCIDDAPDVELS